MNKELENQYKAYKTFIEKHYLPVLNQKIEDHAAFLNKVDELQGELFVQDFSQLTSVLQHIVDYKKKLEPLVDRHFLPTDQVLYDVDYLSYNQAVNDYLKNEQEEVVRPQDKERLIAQNEDSAALKFAKWWKRSAYSTSVLPLRFANWCRSLFKKPVKELPVKTHHIHQRNLCEHYFKQILPVRLLPLLDELYRELTSSSQICLAHDEELNQAFNHFLKDPQGGFTGVQDQRERVEKAQGRLLKLRETIEKKAEQVYDELFREYADAYSKAGTIELSNNLFSRSKIDKKSRVLNTQYSRLVVGWQNTLLVLSDDWEIDLELYALIYAGLREYLLHVDILEERIASVINEKLKKIKTFLKKCEQDIQQAKDDQLAALLEKQILKVKNDLVSVEIPETNQLILSQDLPSLINDLESKIDRSINSVSQRRAVVKGMDYSKPVKSSAINYISPSELIHFESWPQFLKVFKATKVSVTERLNQLQNKVIDVGHIAEFNLESALSLFEKKEGADNPKTIASEGVSRTIEKVEDIEKGLVSLSDNVKENILTGFNRFRDSLIQFTSNENIYEIRVRIARGKAVERSKRYKKEVVDKVRNLLPALTVYFKTKYQHLTEFIDRIFRRYGISAEQTITTELADFLAETRKSIEKLPFVYQRLFKTESLSDPNFFEGRNEELLLLNNAYNNWMKDRFASVVIVGEKGSGITTLLNFYLKDLTTSSKVHRFSPKEHLHSPEELVTFLSQQFEQEFNSPEELVSWLNNRKRVVILENIQRLYLRKVDGFGALKLFSELISLTSKQVFWIMSCTQYSWEYLSKTINLSDHFSYVIPLRELDGSTIVQIIRKRHRVSGYNIEYEPAVSDLNNKKFKRLPHEERQAILERAYFTDLNRIAKSNVSLALIYWLRSTKEINDNTIVIGSLKTIDFSFMKNLPADKVFALANLLLHERLSEEDFSEVTNSTPGKTRALLQPLFEDGIITMEQDEYMINPLLYRQTINMLRMRNIIH